MFYYVYVLGCENKNKKRKFYIGYCSDFEKRLKRHFNKEVKTTKKFDKINLIYFEVCLNKTDARKREFQLKTGFGREYLKRRLENYLKSGSSSVGRTSPFQGEGRGFKSHLPLQESQRLSLITYSY